MEKNIQYHCGDRSFFITRNDGANYLYVIRICVISNTVLMKNTAHDKHEHS